MLMTVISLHTKLLVWVYDQFPRGFSLACEMKEQLGDFWVLMEVKLSLPMALLHLPDLILNGLGAHSRAIPLAVLSV